MKFVFTPLLLLLCSLSLSAQIDIPLLHSKYYTSYKDGEIVAKRHLVSKTYEAPRVARYESFDTTGKMTDWFEIVTDENDNELQEIWWYETHIDTIWRVYTDLGLYREIYWWGEDQEYDTTAYIYDATKLLCAVEERYTFGTFIDSLYYEDTVLVKRASFGDGTQLESYDTYRYNRKGLPYITTSFTEEDQVFSRVTKIYNSNGDVKEYKSQFYPLEGYGELRDNAWFSKFDVDFNKTKTIHYNYVDKIKTVTRYKYDEQGRITLSTSVCKKEGTKEVYEFVYPE